MRGGSSSNQPASSLACHPAQSTIGRQGCRGSRAKAAGAVLLLGSPCQGLPSGKEVGSAST
jgi:hypothetical protein